MIKEKLKMFNIEVDDIETINFENGLIQQIARKYADKYDLARLELVLNGNIITAKDKFTGINSYMGMRISLEPLEKDISFIIRPTDKPTYEQLQQENTQLKEQLKDENNYHEEASKWYKEAFDTTQENIKLKSVLKEIREKCKEPKKEMDYTIWVKLRHQIETLEDFEKDIDYKTHPALTSAYKSDIKNAIKDLCQIIKYKLVYKEDIKEIIDKGIGEDK